MTLLGMVLLIALLVEMTVREFRLVATESAGSRPLFTAAEAAMMVGVAVLLGAKVVELLT